MKRRGFLLQVGGAGKGCGKTAVICRLLDVFPGAAAVKSGTHHVSDEVKTDSRLFTVHGASEAGYHPETFEPRLVERIESLLGENRLVFLEKNRRIPSCPPDLYLYVEREVNNPRTDREFLKRQADYVITDLVIPCDLIELIQARRP
ncbi:hypothetical protein JXA40_04590 [bacterium]|nr:hypothetical protein [candidate division CSSED10-310 bacterium]